MRLSETEAWRQGLAAEAAGEPARALSLYSDLFVRLESDGRAVPSALVERMADSCRALEEFTRALDLFKVARDGMLEVDDLDGGRRVTARMSATLLEAGRPDDALSLLRDVLGLAPEEELLSALPPTLEDDAGASLSAMACGEVAARCLASTGRYLPAIDIARRVARAARRALPARAAEYDFFVAELLVDSGAFAEALAMIPSPPSSGWSLLAARIRRFMGELGVALEHCNFVHDATVSAVLRSKGVLLQAAILSQLNRLGAADAILQAAASREGTPPAWRTRLLGVAATLSLRRQAAQDATPLPLGLDDLWAFADEGEQTEVAGSNQAADDGGERFADRVAMALNRIAVELAQSRTPVLELSRIQALRDGCDSPLQLQRLWAGEAWVRYYSEEYPMADECWSRALALAVALGTPFYAWEARLCLSWCAARRGDTVAQEQLAKAARDDLEGIAAALDVAQRRHFMLNKVSARDEYIALEACAISRPATSSFRIPWLGAWIERRRQRIAVRNLMNRLALIAEFGVTKQLEPTAMRANADTVVTANQVERLVQRQLELTRNSAPNFARRHFALNSHRRLKPEELLVQYLPLPDQLLIIWTTRKDAGLIHVPVTRPQLDAAVRDCLKGIMEEEELSLPRSHALDPLRRLSQLLRIEELSGVAKRCKHWFVAPADVLVNVPFAALMNDNGSFLAESHSISLLPNPAWLRATVRRPKKTERALVVGCSAYPDASLPHALQEARAVAEQLDGRFGVTSLIDSAAKEESVVEELSRAHLAHFSCHGYANADAPLDSCLRFSGTVAGGERLTAQRVYGLKLSLRVAVLAACRASASTPLPDNDLVGIPAAFLYAGAESVVAPLWEISDELAGNFMLEFHREMVDKSAAAALSAVQRARCRCKDETQSRLYHWAAYTCFALN